MPPIASSKKRSVPTKASLLLSQALKNDLTGADWPREGSVVEVEFIKKTSRQAFFDLGRFGTGIVYGIELLNARDVVHKLSPGDRLPAKIVELDGEDGYIELSLAEADKQRLWQQVKDLQEAGEIIKVKAMGANSGGLTAQLGNLDLRAFLPVSQLSSEHYPKMAENDPQKVIEELKKLVGEELKVKIIDVNPRNNKLIISEREVISENVRELVGQYQVGQAVDCLVTGIADFGVFVRMIDNPQVEGLIHISELDYQLIESPKEIVSMNESIKAKIIEIRDGRIFFSLKALKENPWEKAGERYSEGGTTHGKIYKLNPFGAVVSLEGGLQGLIHISEFGGADEMKQSLVPGQTYEFIIDSIKPEERRINLKLKKA